MNAKTESGYLFPAYPIMHIGLGVNYTEYPLSKVLGSWGLTIRDIGIHGNGTAEVRCYGGENGEVTTVELLRIMPLFPLQFDPALPHCMDLILRYDENEQRQLSNPRWAKAIWMNFGGCIVLDAVGQKSHTIRFTGE